MSPNKVNDILKKGDKNGRMGYLFQNWYKSEVVKDERYLIAILIYIHQNLVKAKIVKRIEKYQWSSYKDYTSKPNNDKFLDYEVKRKYIDEKLKKIINSRINTKSINEMSKKERNEIISDSYKITGVSIR